MAKGKPFGRQFVPDHEWQLSATSGRSEMAAWVRSKVKTVLKRRSSARYRATRRGMAEELSCLRRHRRPGNIVEVRRPDFATASASIRR